MTRLIAAVVAAAVTALMATGVGSAAPPEPQAFNCQGLGDIMIIVAPSSDNANSFGAARIVGGGHLIPVSFSFSAYDQTAHMQLFADSAVKGNGNGNRNQQTTTCSSSVTETLADLIGSGPPPPGTSLTDIVTFTINATVIVK